jgi:hypothetical protein
MYYICERAIEQQAASNAGERSEEQEMGEGRRARSTEESVWRARAKYARAVSQNLIIRSYVFLFIHHQFTSSNFADI